MAATPFPIPREARQTGVLAGHGAATYGPFAFRCFDTADVKARIKVEGETSFEQVPISVAKVSGTPMDFFTVTFDRILTSQDQFVVFGARTPERSAGVTKGSQIDSAALEKELSKAAIADQELRRDVDRAVLTEFGGAGKTVAANLLDGQVLVVKGDRLEGGPEAGKIGEYASDAEEAAAAAVAARETAGEYLVETAALRNDALAASAQAQNLLDAAQAAYVGFQPGTFYDLGRVTDPFQLFPSDLGRVADL